MTEPTTANIALIVPNTGDLVGAWGTSALNANWQAVDGLFAGVVSLSLAAATTITLTVPAGSITPGGGPNQSQNFGISLSGSLAGNAVLKFTLPGRYTIFNNCSAGTSYVQLSPSAGTGRSVGVPPGEYWQAAFDGTHMYLLGLPHVGVFLDICTNTTPPWMNAFSVAPYLLCNGATYSTATFPALAAQLGTTYGGNGINTFGVPDQQNRYRIPLDLGGNLRITPGGSGIDGTVWGAAGGSQLAQAHAHGATSNVTDPGHMHAVIAGQQNNGGSFVSETGVFNNNNGVTGTATTGITVSTVVNSSLSGGSQNIPPGIVAGLTFIKT